MKTVTFSSNSDKKINLLIQIANEMGIKPNTELNDEEMAMPGPKVSKERLEDWLAKDDGGSVYTSKQLKASIKKSLSKKKSTNGHRI